MLKLLQWVIANQWLMRLLSAVSGSFNPWNPTVRRNPYPSYAQLRAQPGLPRLRLFGGYVAARYAEVEHLLRNPAFSTNREAVPLLSTFRRAASDTPEFLGFLDNNLLMLDGARHRRLRGLVSKAFTPRRVEMLRSRVAAIVDNLLESLAPRAEIDIVRDLAQPLPAIVIADLLGIPSSDQAQFRHWSDELVEILDPLSGREGLDPPKRAMRALAAYFRPLLAERRGAPRDDLLSAMIAAEDAGETLSEDELIALASLILAAGHETTTNLIGNAVMLLLRHPSERKRLQDDLGLLASAVEECLRVEPPVQLTDRAVVEPTELAGTRLQRGEIVVALLASANRDPARFPDPDRFDVARGDNDHLSFGLGNHYCLGASLARLEAQVALGALLRRFPDCTGPP
ncbi:MAG TPA: cytochrome P450, partial [Candidatus Kryptonia bacterium]|nr:cytochrome P450 [Candidatus Kryptonia bacterium]